jgi:3-deoxy-D-arabino-heptulosonate 7-phosphate (DAHP) synthase class II
MATSNGSGKAEEWSPSSWRKFPVKQQAPFPDAAALDGVRAKRTFVAPGEANG